jgi:hypothetical protein
MHLKRHSAAEAGHPESPGEAMDTFANTQRICLIVTFNPFLFIKNKRLFISSEGFSVLEKNTMIFSQGNAAHPSADSDGSWVHFSFKFELPG